MLNIQKIFKAQDKLDRKVVEVHGLEGKNLTGNVTHALFTELGELSNEIGFFKYWKKNKKNDKARQYDEWADCMHFLASLGNKYGHVEEILTLELHDEKYILHQAEESNFHDLFNIIYKVELNRLDHYAGALASLLMIGTKIGMTFEIMEKSYFDKNQVNYDRLASGY